MMVRHFDSGPVWYRCVGVIEIGEDSLMPEGCDEVFFPNSISSVVEAVRLVLTTNPQYRDTRENADHTTFETTIKIPWSLIGMPLTVTVIAKEGQTLVSATVRSRWWAQVDTYGSRDTNIREFFKALRMNGNS